MTKEEVIKIDSTAKFSNTAMLMVIKNAEMRIEDKMTKGRLVILGNNIYDMYNKYAKIKRGRTIRETNRLISKLDEYCVRTIWECIWE